MSLQLGLPIMLLAALLQATVLPHLRVYGGQPDLVLIVVLAWSILDRGYEGMVWAFFGGLCLDLFSGLPMGISSLALVPISFAIGLTEARIYRTNVALPVVFAGAGALAYHVITLILLRFVAGIPVVWALIWWYVMLPSILFDLVLIIPALRLLGRRYVRMHPRQVRM